MKRLDIRLLYQVLIEFQLALDYQRKRNCSFRTAVNATSSSSYIALAILHLYAEFDNLMSIDNE